jgi:catechol 2,3-dioxygenase
LPDGTRIGHTRLFAASLGFPEGMMVESFRMGDVGLDERQPYMIAFNTWKGTRIPPAPANSLGMRHFSIVLKIRDELQRVKD